MPIANPGQYEFAIYKSSNWWANKLEVESVELTYIERPYIGSMAYYSLPAETEANIANQLYYKGHGNAEFRHSSGYLRYVYDGVDGIYLGNVSEPIVNEYNLINYPFEKKWLDVGYEELRPESVTFSLFNERDAETVVSEVTLNRDDAEDGNIWSGVFENVPEYNNDVRRF